MRSTRRAPSATVAPWAERYRAVASPNPLLAPVMTTIFPSMLLFVMVTPAADDHQSAPRPLLELLRIAGALHLDLRRSGVDRAEVLGRQVDVRGAEVLLEPVQLRGPRDRHGPRLLRQQPRQRDLRGRRLLLPRDLAEQIDQGLVRLARLRREARHDVAEVVLVERGLLVDLPGQEPLPERAERDEPDPELLERREHLLFRLPPPQRVLALERRDRLHRVCTADRLRARLREAEVLDLALADQVLHGARDVLDRHVRIDAVLVKEVDRVDPESLERGLCDLLDVLGPAVEGAPVCLAVEGGLEAELGGEHNLAAEGRQRLAHELLVRERPVDLGGVEEGDDAIERGPNERDHLPLVRWRAVAKAHPHAAEPEGRDLQVALAESPLLHRRFSLCVAEGPSLPPASVGLERSHVDREAVLHVRREQPLVRFVDLLDGDDLDVGGDALLSAEVEHLLRFANAADRRSGEAATPEQEAEGGDAERLLRRADEGDVAVAAEELDVRVDVVIGGHGVEDEIEAAGVLPHLVGVARDDDLVGAEAE